ncbi:unnamed protein product, partial [Closterium sp. NIES-54]
VWHNTSSRGAGAGGAGAGGASSEETPSCPLDGCREGGKVPVDYIRHVACAWRDIASCADRSQRLFPRRRRGDSALESEGMGVAGVTHHLLLSPYCTCCCVGRRGGELGGVRGWRERFCRASSHPSSSLSHGRTCHCGGEGEAVAEASQASAAATRCYRGTSNCRPCLYLLFLLLSAAVDRQSSVNSHLRPPGWLASNLPSPDAACNPDDDYVVGVGEADEWDNDDNMDSSKKYTQSTRTRRPRDPTCPSRKIINCVSPHPPPSPPSPSSMGMGGRGCEGVADVPQQQQLPPRLLLYLSLPHLVLGEGGELGGSEGGRRGSAAPAPPRPPPFLLHPCCGCSSGGRGSAALCCPAALRALLSCCPARPARPAALLPCAPCCPVCPSRPAALHAMRALQPCAPRAPCCPAALCTMLPCSSVRPAALFAPRALLPCSPVRPAALCASRALQPCAPRAPRVPCCPAALCALLPCSPVRPAALLLPLLPLLLPLHPLLQVQQWGEGMGVAGVRTVPCSSSSSISHCCSCH